VRRDLLLHWDVGRQVEGLCHAPSSEEELRAPFATSIHHRSRTSHKQSYGRPTSKALATQGVPTPCMAVYVILSSDLALASLYGEQHTCWSKIFAGIEGCGRSYLLYEYC